MSDNNDTHDDDDDGDDRLNCKNQGFFGFLWLRDDFGILRYGSILFR